MSKINTTWKLLDRAGRRALTLMSALYGLSATTAAAAEKICTHSNRSPLPVNPIMGESKRDSPPGCRPGGPLDFELASKLLFQSTLNEVTFSEFRSAMIWSQKDAN